MLWKYKRGSLDKQKPYSALFPSSPKLCFGSAKGEHLIERSHTRLYFRGVQSCALEVQKGSIRQRDAMVGYETSLRGIYRYMEIKKEYKDDIVILHISGYMVADTIDKLKETIQKCQDEKINKVILNLELVKMIDSSGIGAIAFMVKRFRLTKGDVKIAHARGHVADIFQMIRLYKTIEIYPSVDESLKSFTG